MEALIERLRAEQNSLALEATGTGFLPSKGVLQQIADLETKIHAIETVMEDR